MNKASLIPLLAALASTAACEAQIGKNEQAGEVGAEGKSREGRVSIKAPGVDIKVDIPEGIRANANVSSDGDLLYPGARMSGLHIEGDEGDGAVELRFTTPDAPDRVAAWYRDPARADFTVDTENREGAGFVFNGREKEDGTPFKLQLTPRNEGTEGMLSILDRK